MSANNRVNSEGELVPKNTEDAAEEPPRWWIRNPTKGVASAAILGVATTWVTLSIKTPDATPGSTLLYIVILPIALLLPAIALSGAFVAWHSYKASRGRLRLLLAAPAAVGLVLNAMAVGLFVRWVTRVFSG